MTAAAQLIFPMVIIPLGIGILQWHSIPFWQGQVGEWSGLAWSVLLEAISLWLWYRPGQRWFRPMAWATTLLLLAGPLHQVSDPLIREIAALDHDSASISQRIQSLEEEIASTERSLDRYQRFAQNRTGWQPNINWAETALSMKRKERQNLIVSLSIAETSASLNWRRIGKIGGQLLSLVIFQMAIIFAISSLSRSFHGAGNIDRTPSVPAGSTYNNDGVENIAVTLQKAIQTLRKSGKTYADIETRFQISQRDLSLLVNHFYRKKRGDRTLGMESMRRIRAKLLARD